MKDVLSAIEHLRQCPPFDSMEPGHLNYLAENAEVEIYSRGQAILKPDAPEPDRFYIVKQGMVEAEPEGSNVLVGWSDLQHRRLLYPPPPAGAT